MIMIMIIFAMAGCKQGGLSIFLTRTKLSPEGEWERGMVGTREN